MIEDLVDSVLTILEVPRFCFLPCVEKLARELLELWVPLGVGRIGKAKLEAPSWGVGGLKTLGFIPISAT